MSAHVSVDVTSGQISFMLNHLGFRTSDANIQKVAGRLQAQLGNIPTWLNPMMFKIIETATDLEKK